MSIAGDSWVTEHLRDMRIRDGERRVKECLEENSVRVGTPEFIQRVRHPKLRAIAERYEYARGNIHVRGPSGVGKTETLKALKLRLLEAAVSAKDSQAPVLGYYSTTGPRIARAMRETRLGTECEELSTVRRYRFVILDELGQEQADPRWLLELLDERYGNGYITFSASGLTRDELEKRYGSGAVRRLVEPCGVGVDLFGEEHT